MLAVLGHQESRLPFYLYAYCLMENHIHLLVERQRDLISRIMQCVLTGYSEYYNPTRVKSNVPLCCLVQF